MTTTPPQDTVYYGDACPETSLRVVDQAIVNWLSSMEFRGQTPKVSTVWASRQFAQQHEIHQGKPVKQAFPLPAVSLAMTGLIPALDRRVVADISRLGMTEASIIGETLWTGTGALAYVQGRTGYFQITPGSIVITAERLVAPPPAPPVFATMTVTDDGDGNLIGDIASGINTIDYDTGKFSVTFLAVVANEKPVKVTYNSQDSKIYVGNDRNEVYILPFPLPFDLTYQVDLWTKTQQDMQWLRTALLTRFAFTNETYLAANFGGYGEKLIPIQLTRLDDTTNLEPEEQERELRNTITLTAKAWIFRCPVRKKVIRGVNIVLLDAGSDSVNIQDGSLFMDWYCSLDHYTFSGTTPAVVTAVAESSTFAPPNRAIAWFGWVNGTLTEVGP